MAVVPTSWQSTRCAVLGLVALGLMAGNVSLVPAHAQTTGSAPTVLVPQRPPVTVTARPGAEIAVPIGKSQLIRVDRAFEEVSVGEPAIADVVPLSQSLVYVLGKQPGATNLTFVGGGGQVIAVVDVQVTYDVEGLKAKLAELLPQEPIEVRPARDAIVLSGQVSDAAAVSRALAIAERYAPERITNLLSVGGAQQVLLAVRFAEVQRSVSKELGLNSLLIDGGGDFRFSLDTGTGIAADAFAVGTLGIDLGFANLDLVFDALEEKGQVRTLAEPNLIALSGDTASFLAGGEFPIPIAQSATLGATVITVEFKQFGVSLAFTPTVLGNEIINLTLNTEVSAIDPSISVETDRIAVPGLSVRRANTTVELRDGQSFAIAGLLQDDFNNSIRQFPWVADVPVLGTLFRSTAFQRRQTELVVVITPRLVRPTAPEALATPLDQPTLPTEAEMFLFGKTTAGVPIPGAPKGGIDGPHGYIIR